MTKFSGWLRPDQVRPWLGGSDRKHLDHETQLALYKAADNGTIRCGSVHTQAYRSDTESSSAQISHTVREFLVVDRVITVHEIAYQAISAPFDPAWPEDSIEQSHRRLFGDREQAEEQLGGYLDHYMPRHALTPEV